MQFISLVGCFTISILSFLLPPLLHLSLVTLPALNRAMTASESTSTVPVLAAVRKTYQQIEAEDYAEEEGFEDMNPEPQQQQTS